MLVRHARSSPAVFEYTVLVDKDDGLSEVVAVVNFRTETFDVVYLSQTPINLFL